MSPPSVYERSCGQRPLLHHRIDYTIGPRLLRRHEKVALGVRSDPGKGLSRVLGDDFVELLAHPEDLPGVDLDFGGLSLRPPHRLVEPDPRVGERPPFPRGPPG